MAAERSRINIQKNEDSSLIKSFFDDQLGLLLTVLGSIPLLADYFSIIPHPINISEISVGAINLVSIFICGILIIFVYRERNRLTNAKKVHVSLIGFMLMGLGFIFFVIYNYNNFVVDIKNIKYYKEFRVRLDIWVATLFGFSLFIVSIILLLFNIYSTIYHYGKIKEIDDRINTLAITDSQVKYLTYRKVIACILTMIFIFFLYLSFRSYAFLKYNWFNTFIFISKETVGIFHTILYFTYYPLILIGSIITLSIVFKSYEDKRNFYQNIDRINKHFYSPIEHIVDDLVNFEIWFDEYEKIDIENSLFKEIKRKTSLATNHARLNRLLSVKKIDLVKKTEDDTMAIFEARAKSIKRNRRAQRHFLWKAMRAKLKHYEIRTSQLSREKGRFLIASGDLIDDLIKHLPYQAEAIQEFRAVSWNDLTFWQKRGEEYLTWSSAMIEEDVKVQRIFLLNSSQDLLGNSDYDFRENLKTIFKQIELGILIGICYIDDIRSFDGSNFESRREYDFGVFPNFGISFFEKPLRIGGRSWRLDFDEDVIKDYTNFFDIILQSSFYNLDINKYAVESNAERKNQSLQRIESLTNFLRMEKSLSNKEYILEEIYNELLIKYYKEKPKEYKRSYPTIKITPTSLSQLDFLCDLDKEMSNLIHCWTKEEHASVINNSNEWHFIINKLEKDKNIEIGYLVLNDYNERDRSIKLHRVVIQKDEQNNGYGKEAAMFIKNFVFNDFPVHLHRLWAAVKSQNKQAILFYTSINFTIEGHLRESFLSGEEYETLTIMSILRKEYIKESSMS